MSPRRSLLATLAATATLGLAACGSSAGGQDPGSGELSVVASTDVWASVVRAVGGPEVSVEAILDKPSADPHAYQATAVDVADLREADMVVYNGGGYDAFVDEILAADGAAASISAFELSGLAGGHGHEHSHEQGHEHGHEHAGANEHVWYDLPTVGKVADAVATELGELRPEQREAFAAGAREFKRQLDTIGGKVDEIAAARDGAKVLATAPVAHYLLDAAGVVDVAPAEFTEAIEEESDVTVAAQQRVLDLVAGGEVRAVVYNVQTATPVTDEIVRVARERGLPVVEVSETLPEGSAGYISWMSGQVDALSKALAA